MVSLYRDPLGERIFSTNGNSNTMNVSKGGALVEVMNLNKDRRIMALESRIKELETGLQERRVRLISTQYNMLNCLVSLSIYYRIGSVLHVPLKGQLQLVKFLLISKGKGQWRSRRCTIQFT